MWERELVVVEEKGEVMSRGENERSVEGGKKEGERRMKEEEGGAEVKSGRENERREEGGREGGRG